VSGHFEVGKIFALLEELKTSLGEKTIN